MKNNGKVHDVRSLACKIKVLNGCVLWTWKWTIGVGTGRSEKHFILPKHFFFLTMPKYVGRSKSSETTRISLWIYDGIISNLVKQSIKLPFSNFSMMFERCSTQGDIWRHPLMTSYNRDPVRKMTEIFLSKWRTITNVYVSFGEYCFRSKRTWLSIIGTNNSLNS